MNMKFKKGELTSEQLVITVILIASFLIILLFWSLLSPTGNSQREICKSSIALRSASSVGNYQFKDIVPLQCTTEKICLVRDNSGKCEGMAETKESPIRKIIISSKQELLDAVSEILYQDSIMTGQGKLNPMPRDYTQSTYCLLTSRIGLDKNLLADKSLIFNNGELLTRLSQKKTEDGISYLKLIYGVDTMEQFNSVRSKNNLDLSNYLNGLNDFSQNEYMVATMFVNSGKLTSIFGGVTAGAASAGLTGWAAYGLVSAGAIASLPVTLIVGVGLGVGALVTYATLPDPDKPQSASENYIYIAPNLYPLTSKSLTDLKCDYIESLP